MEEEGKQWEEGRANEVQLGSHLRVSPAGAEALDPPLWRPGRCWLYGAFALVKLDYTRLAVGRGDMDSGWDISITSKSGDQDYPRKGQLELVRLPQHHTPLS